MRFQDEADTQSALQIEITHAAIDYKAYAKALNEYRRAG